MNIFEPTKPLNPLWNGQLPVDPVLILRAMLHKNFKIKVFSNDEMNKVGSIEKNEEGFQVTYSTKEQLIRQRYFLAFAVGYIAQGFMDSQHLVEFDIPDFTLNKLDLANYKSNLYALELLMPQRIVNFCVFKKGMANIEQLSQTFQVSTAAMHTQLKRCKLVG